MSGICGVVSQTDIKVSSYDNLIKWNRIYGELSPELFSDKTVLLSIIPERLKNIEKNSASLILKRNNYIGVSDCLIFSPIDDGISDEEYIFNSICDNGINTLHHINGNFSGAVWDNTKSELILYRDHLGTRPLYYYQDKSVVIFSSDLRGIVSLNNVDCSIDEKWIYYNIANIYFPSSIDTEYQNIKCVPPGGYIKFTFNKDCISSYSGKYWIPGTKKIKMKNRQAYSNELRHLVEDAVRIRANATNLSVGAELSGGLDSGIISLLLANMKKDCFYYSWSPSPDVLPYSDGDERLIIKDICDKSGIKCNYGGLKVSFSEHTQMRERSPLSFSDETENLTFPYKYAFPCYINTTQIYETAAVMQENGVKFVFTGHSGDEGISHRSNPYELFYNHEYYRYFRLMFSRSSKSKHRIIGTIKLIAENQRSFRDTFLKPIPYDEVRYQILNKDFVKNLKPEEQRFLFPYDPKNYIRNGGIRNRFDVVAFYGASVGVRYLAPFADYRLIDFALGIPRYLYHNWYIDRFVFREAFKDIMPRSMYYLREKANHSYDSLHNKVEEKEKIEQTDERLIKARRETLSKLNKAYWEKYLNYDVLEDWVNGKFSAEDDLNIAKALYPCIQAEYLVKRSKELK